MTWTKLHVVMQLILELEVIWIFDQIACFILKVKISTNFTYTMASLLLFIYICAFFRYATLYKNCARIYWRKFFKFSFLKIQPKINRYESLRRKNIFDIYGDINTSNSLSIPIGTWMRRSISNYSVFFTGKIFFAKNSNH